MYMAVEKRGSLSTDDWTRAALDALARGGLAAVAVEPLAKALGTTKGSFYWHFGGRDDLIAAALERWEQRDTENVIAAAESDPDPARRLAGLLRLALGAAGDRSQGTVELALQVSAAHPLVAPVLGRVTQRRLRYLTGAFEELGFAPAEAGRRGLLAYTSYLGHAQLAHATPDLVPSGPEFDAHVDGVVAALVASAPA